jgi:thioesterase domain-containing protein/acyl carrier protein
MRDAKGSMDSNSTIGYAPPQGEMETKLAEVWARVLRLERVGRHDDFFALGGDSLGAVQLMTQLQEVIPGEMLPLRAILEAPTVELLAEWVKNEQGNEEGNEQGSDQRLLVRIKAGAETRPAFFCVHASDGTAIGMQPLAMAMGEDLPFYCLQAKGLDGSEPFATVEEAAACYLSEMRSVQPHGPYSLGGYCFGGFVAFEMARLLEQEGEPVATLVLIDAFNPAFLRNSPAAKMLLYLLKFYVRRLGMHVRRLSALSPSAWLGYVGGRAKAVFVHAGRYGDRLARVKAKQAGADPYAMENETASGGEAGSDFEGLIKRLERVGPDVARKFEPKTYGGGAIVFRVSERSDDPYEDFYLGWRRVIRGTMESFEIDATHESILTEPDVRALAEKIDVKLRESESRK